MGRPLKYNCSNCTKLLACEPYIGDPRYYRCSFYHPTKEIVEHDRMIKIALSIAKNSTYGLSGGHNDEQK